MGESIETSSQSGEPGILGLRNSATGVSDLVMNQPALPLQPTATKRQLTEQELEVLRPMITRLYIDEGLRYEDVRKYLLENYNVDPTQKQFSGWRRKWGMKKNTTIRDRQKILNDLEESKKDVSEESRVGNFNLTVEKIIRWKKEIGQAAGLDNMPATQQRIDQLPHHSKPLEMIDSSWDESSRYGQHDNPASSYRPSSPRIFLLPENLFFNVDLYMEQLCGRAAFIKTGNRDYRFNIPDSETKATTLEKFVGYTKQALQFAATNRLVEARKVLSMACGLTRTLLEDENPIAYMNLVNTMLEYWDEPSEFFHQFNDLFIAYISRMAAIVLPYGHPWRTIWVVIGAVNTDQVREILLVSLDCMVNTLKRNIGSYQGIAVNGRLLHTKWKYSRDLPAAETALRSLIPESADPSNGTYKSYFKAMFHLARNLRLQGKYNDGIIIAKQHLAHARVYGDIDDLVNALNLNANMYHHMGEKAIAETHIREAADTMLAKLEATSATWGIYLLGILEDWVRKDGRIQEADDIKAEVADLMERDKIRDDTEEE